MTIISSTNSLQITKPQNSSKYETPRKIFCILWRLEPSLILTPAVDEKIIPHPTEVYLKYKPCGMEMHTKEATFKVELLTPAALLHQ